VARLFILVALIVGVVTTMSCSSAVAQPTATTQPATATAQPTATTQPTTAPVQPTATTLATTTPVAPTATTQPTKASATPTPQASSGQQKLNLDDYFPKGAGRDLVLRDCTTCHSFVPIITGQRTNDRWLSLKKDHKDKASGVTQADYDEEFAYLMENFNNTKPEPKLPDWFIQQQPGVGE
jgi:hypothetical protein